MLLLRSGPLGKPRRSPKGFDGLLSPPNVQYAGNYMHQRQILTGMNLLRFGRVSGSNIRTVFGVRVPGNQEPMSSCLNSR